MKPGTGEKENKICSQVQTTNRPRYSQHYVLLYLLGKIVSLPSCSSDQHSLWQRTGVLTEGQATSAMGLEVLYPRNRQVEASSLLGCSQNKMHQKLKCGRNRFHFPPPYKRACVCVLRGREQEDL